MSELKLIWFGHGTTKIETPGGIKILIDPFLSGNPACRPENRNDRDFDLLLVTHGHGDHFGDTLSVLKESGASVACIYEMANHIISKGAHEQRVFGFNIGGTIEFAGLEITMTPALHSSLSFSEVTPVNMGPPVGFILRLEDDRKIYFAGDTDIFSEMEFIAEFHKPFLAVLPIDGYYNMSPQAAARAVQILKCEHVLPVHHSTFPTLWGKPKMLREEMDKLGLETVTMHRVSPGDVISL